ncbi:MAG: hypothetical protein QM726_15900 [Chitinophagaceae bacterium]
MKYLLAFVLLAILSCNNHEHVSEESIKKDSAKSSPASETIPQSKTEICWTGFLNTKTPVFLHYQLDSNIVIGEIIYLNTKDKLPITIIGTIEDDKNYRLLEFEKSGNITGVITGKPMGNVFNGDWVSPKTEKELVMSLVKKDTLVNASPITAELPKIFGKYHYQYGEKGYQGDFELSQLPESKASFGITSVTSDPARNIAQIEDDTIPLTKTRFTYELPGTKDCGFEVKFYKDFLRIKYTTGFCEGQFGNNATIDGIFLKVQ